MEKGDEYSLNIYAASSVTNKYLSDIQFAIDDESAVTLNSSNSSVKELASPVGPTSDGGAFRTKNIKYRKNIVLYEGLHTITFTIPKSSNGRSNAAFTFDCATLTPANTLMKVKNSKNVGIYTTEEMVSLEITRYREETDEYIFKILDIDGNIISERNFIADEKTEIFQIGYFPSGWYRVKIFCNDVESNIFVSFSVIQESEANSLDISPFAIMHLGAFATDRDSDYVEALKRLSAGTVRTEEIADIYKAERPYEKYNTSLYNAGINTMSTIETNFPTPGTSKGGNIGGITDLLEVYDVHKTMVDAYGGIVSNWEIINEPDLRNTASADAYASWYKAAALAVGDSQPEAVKSFGGLAATGTYSDILMQNDIMKYSDTFNVHSHVTDTTSGAKFPGGIVNNAKIYSALYGDNNPVWCTEAGVRLEVADAENELPADEALRRQARYMITSFMQSIGKYGADKNFWFLANHYITEGPEYGIFSKNHMPYPAVSSFNILTDNLKDGILLGSMKPAEDMEGYFFDCGDYDAAVVWKKTSGKGSLQFNTNGNVSVISLIGNKGIKKYSSATGKVSIDISQDPVLIKFSAKASSDDYIKTAFKKNVPNLQPITDIADRVILQQIWEPKPEIVNGLYRIDDTTEYTVKFRIYNFNTDAVSGSYYVDSSDGIEVLGSLSGSYNVGAGSYTEECVTVKVSKGTGNYLMENLALYAETSDGNKISPSISQMQILSSAIIPDGAEISVIPEANYYSNAEQGDTYSSQVRPTATNYQSAWLGGENKVKYTSGQISNSTVPAQLYIYQNNLNVNKDSDGMYFEFTCDSFPSMFDSAYFDVSVNGEEGSYSFNKVFEFNGDTKNKKVYIPWTSFTATGNGITDPSKISTFHFGWNISSSTEYSLAFTIKDMGTYKAHNSENSDNIIEITGVLDSEEYYTSLAKAKVKTNDTEATEIYINYEKAECVADENGIFNIDFSEYEPGSYSLIVARQGEFNKKYYKEVKFTLLEDI